MSIHALPLELLRLILSYCDPESIASLTSTCHSLKRHALPLLYHDINHNYRFHQKPRNHSYRFTIPSLPDIQLLTRSILYNPSLGPKIAHLRLRGPELWPSISKTATSFQDTDLNLLAARGKQIGHSTLPVWKHVLLSNGREAVLVILLSYLSSLTTLSFEDDPNVHFNVHHSPLGSWNPPLNTHPHLASKPVSLFAEALAKLPSLHTIELGLCNEGVRLSHNAPILRVLQSLTSLRTLRIALRQPPTTSSSAYFPLLLPIPITTSPLTKLELHACALSERSTVLVTSRFPNLTTLSLSFLRRALSPMERAAGRIPPDSHTWLDCTLLGTYLAEAPPVKLQHLSISVSFVSNPGMGEPVGGGAWESGREAWNADPIHDFGVKGCIGSLRFLGQLKSLEIPAVVLGGWYPERAESLVKLLPDSLEELRFGRDVEGWASCKWDARALRDWEDGLRNDCRAASRNVPVLEF